MTATSIAPGDGTASGNPPRDRPILFSGPMVNALLEGRKTQTRRIIKPQPPTREAVHSHAGIGYDWMHNTHRPGTFRPVGPVWAVRKAMDLPGSAVPELRCPHGAPKDRLWVREGHCYYGAMDAHVGYRATDAETLSPDAFDRWRPSIHMPRWASRILLEVVSVRVERLQDISEADAQAEGLKRLSKDGGQTWKYGIPEADGLPGPTGWAWRDWDQDPRQAFRRLWDGINAERGYGWEVNPWVWALELRRIDMAPAGAEGR